MFYSVDILKTSNPVLSISDNFESLFWRGQGQPGDIGILQHRPEVLSHFSHVTSWTIAHQAPLSMGFSRQEYWSGLPCPPPGDLPDPGIMSTSLWGLPALAGRFFTTGTIWKVLYLHLIQVNTSAVTQSCPTLCNPMDCSLPGSSIHGVFQARVLEWVAISFSRASSQLRDQTRVSHIAGRRFTIWATREAQRPDSWKQKIIVN